MTTGSRSLLKLPMVGQLTHYCLGKAVLKSDGVREEVSLVELGSGKM